jgi:hypothetical protein
VNFAARMQRLENSRGIGGGRCPECGPVRAGRVVPRLTVVWFDDETPPVPRLCARCGEPLLDISLTFGLDHEVDA